MSPIPATLYYRERQLVGSRSVPPGGRRKPRGAVPGLLPFSGATLWRMVKARKFPQPVKLADRVTAWRAEDVLAWLAAVNADGNPQQ